MCDTPTKTQYRPIAEIVQEATNGGQLIVEFLVDMVVGKIEGANHWHRLEATRQLERLGVKIPNAVKQAATSPANGTKTSRASGKPEPKDELADIIREETRGGREIVRFLMDAMQGKLEDFKPRHRLAASDRLITRGFDNVPGHTVAASEDDGRYNAEDAPFDFENYTIDDFARDRDGTRALFHIFGGEKARKAASKAYAAYRWKSDTELDYDRSPIENPGDDPFGKGCYGYKVLALNYGDNEGIRIANKAALEFHRQRHKHLLNEDGSLNALADTSSLDPRTLQYLERNRHLLAEKDEPPEPPAGPDSKPVPDTERSQEPTVGEGLRPSRDPEGSPTSAQPSSSAAPGQPQNTRVGEGLRPSRGYGHCRDCSETVGEDFNPSRDPPHVTPEPTNVILSEAEGSPAPEPPPRKKRLNIHLGPPGEDDPPDEDSRHYRDPDEIRVPLHNLSSISPVPF